MDDQTPKLRTLVHVDVDCFHDLIRECARAQVTLDRAGHVSMAADLGHALDNIAKPVFCPKGHNLDTTGRCPTCDKESTDE